MPGPVKRRWALSLLSPALDGPAADGSLRFDHNADMLQGVEGGITETEPDRTVGGRTPQGA